MNIKRTNPNFLSIILSVIAFVVSAYVLAFSLTNQMSLRQELIEIEIEHIQASFIEAAKRGGIFLSALDGLFVNGQSPGFKNFGRAINAANMGSYPALKAIYYVPIVEHADRDATEAALQESFSNFQFTERSPNNRVTRAHIRDQYYPLAYVEPYLDNRVDSGFDLGTIPEIKALLLKSQALGTPIASSPQLQGLTGILLVHPLYHKDSDGTTNVPDGWLVGRLEVKLLLREHLFADSDLLLAIDDITNPAKPVTLFTNGLASEQHYDDISHFKAISTTPGLLQILAMAINRTDLHFTMDPVEIYGRTYQFRPWVPVAIAFQGIWILPVIGFLSLMAVFVILIIILNSSQRAAAIALEAAKRQSEQLDESNQRLKEIQVTDSLTGLSNKRHTTEFLDKEWRRSLRVKRPFAVILLNLDHFGAYVDQHGQSMGDDAMVAMAKALSAHVDFSTDIIGRFSNKEFIAILPNASSVNPTADKMVAAVSELNLLSVDEKGNTKRVTISATGAAFQASASKNSASAIKQLISAMISVKVAGGNRAVEIETD